MVRGLMFHGRPVAVSVSCDQANRSSILSMPDVIAVAIASTRRAVAAGLILVSAFVGRRLPLTTNGAACVSVDVSLAMQSTGKWELSMSFTILLRGGLRQVGIDVWYGVSYH
jgi:hypothetical protein